MFKKILTNIKTALYVVVIAMIWSRTVLAVDLSAGQEGSLETLPFYLQLSQNIENEAAHYSDYYLYQGPLRVQNFWDQLEQLNLSRDEIIQTITMLEKRMEGRILESDYKTGNGQSVFSRPLFLAGTFSNWRVFYVLISGGFFLMNIFLLSLAVCVTCRRNLTALVTDNLKKMIPGNQDLGDGPFHERGPFHKKAA